MPKNKTLHDIETSYTDIDMFTSQISFPSNQNSQALIFYLHTSKSMLSENAKKIETAQLF